MNNWEDKDAVWEMMRRMRWLGIITYDELWEIWGEMDEEIRKSIHGMGR